MRAREQLGSRGVQNVTCILAGRVWSHLARGMDRGDKLRATGEGEGVAWGRCRTRLECSTLITWGKSWSSWACIMEKVVDKGDGSVGV